MTLTLIVPAYKKPKSLRRCLKSLWDNAPGAELIVIVDDGSDLNNLRREFPGTRVEPCGNGSGAGIAITKGALLAKGDFIGFLGDDTEILTPRADELIVAACTEAGPGCVHGFDDGVNGGRAHTVMSRDLWLSGGGYPPAYRMYRGDVEIRVLAAHHGAWRTLPVQILHHHPDQARRGRPTDIWELTQVDALKMARGDGATYQRRMAWWENNGKPRVIPWNI